MKNNQLHLLHQIKKERKQKAIYVQSVNLKTVQVKTFLQIFCPLLDQLHSS